MTPRHVRGLNRGVPVPFECAILNVPFGNTAVSTLLPGWLTPPAVNAPVAMMLNGALLAVDVVTSWKCSNAGLPAPAAALAAVRPVAACAPATATMRTPVTPRRSAGYGAGCGGSPALCWRMDLATGKTSML